METQSSALSCYVAFRVILGAVDLVTDGLQSAILFDLKHPFWASLTLLLPLLAFLMALCSVAIAKSRSGNSMSAGKFFILALRSLVLLYEGLFESGPQLILQLVTLCHGVHLEDFSLLLVEQARFTWAWYRGLCYLLALIFSCSSLVVSLIYYNEDRISTDGKKFTLSVLNSLSCILYRVFLAVVMFSAAPFWSLGLCTLLYFIHLACYKAAGQSWEAVLYSYASLFVPSGHAKEQGQGLYYHGVRERSTVRRDGPRGCSLSEVERAKINQESTYKQVKVSYGSYVAISFILLVPYVIFVELYFMDKIGIIAAMKNRLVLYLIPLALLMSTICFSMLYWLQSRKARDAARHWFAITPHRNRSRASTPIRSQRHSDEDQPSTPLKPSAPLPHSKSLEPNGATQTSISEANEVRSPFYSDLSRDNFSVGVRRSYHLPPGTRRCDKNACVTCELLVEGSNFHSEMTGKDYRFMTSLSCDAKNVVYLVTCNKCRKQYVGKTDQPLKQRHYGHRREIEMQSTPLGKHFAEGCGYVNWRFQIIDQCKDNPTDLRRREGYWQHELMTLLPWGLNTRDELNGGLDVNYNGDRT